MKAGYFRAVSYTPMYILLYQQAVDGKRGHINKYHSLNYVVFTRDDHRRAWLCLVDNMECNLLKTCAVAHSTARRSVLLHGVRAGAAESQSSCLGLPDPPARQISTRLSRVCSADQCAKAAFGGGCWVVDM